MKKPKSEKDLAVIIEEAKPRHPLVKWIIIAAILTAGGAAWHFFFRKSGDKGEPTYTTEVLKRA